VCRASGLWPSLELFAFPAWFCLCPKGPPWLLPFLVVQGFGSWPSHGDSNWYPGDTCPPFPGLTWTICVVLPSGWSVTWACSLREEWTRGFLGGPGSQLLWIPQELKVRREGGEELRLGSGVASAQNGNEALVAWLWPVACEAAGHGSMGQGRDKGAGQQGGRILPVAEEALRLSRPLQNSWAALDTPRLLNPECLSLLVLSYRIRVGTEAWQIPTSPWSPMWEGFGSRSPFPLMASLWSLHSP
jgi:hypothetical protein